MWSYLARRLLIMVPTLFGITIVSFLIMQLAPGDPLLVQASAAGSAGQSLQTREAYLIQKRDLKLDKPLFLNFHYFRDYDEVIRSAAHFLSRTPAEVQEELPALAAAADDPATADPDTARRLRFLQSIGVDGLEKRLRNPDQHARLAKSIETFTRVFCEDIGTYALPSAIVLMQARDEPLALRIGAIRATNLMVVESFVSTYSVNPTDEQTAEVVGTWTIWWDRNKGNEDYQELDDEQRQDVAGLIAELVKLESKTELIDRLDEEFYDGHVPYLVEILLGESTLQEKVVTSIALTKLVGQPLKTDVPLSAKEPSVDDVAANWNSYFEPRKARYAPSTGRKVWNIVADTQYAHMVWRLATFNFGRSALRTREPVADKLWKAVKVSAPIMLLSQVLIYLVAVPLGVICGVNRGKAPDRTISLGLFALYSIPPFVAGMLFLIVLCYGRPWAIFPPGRLHSQGAEQFGAFRYALDYVWHIVLPVVCLSLFSLASLAMYARASLLDAISQDYIRTARAKGLSGRVVVLKHALRNSLIPVITLLSNMLPAMLGGSVLIEAIFNVPGMGFLSWSSIEQKDVPTLMALIYIDAIVVMVSILLTDLLYVIVDPRISFAGRGEAA